MAPTEDLAGGPPRFDLLDSVSRLRVLRLGEGGSRPAIRAVVGRDVQIEGSWGYSVGPIELPHPAAGTRPQFSPRPVRHDPGPGVRDHQAQAATRAARGDRPGRVPRLDGGLRLLDARH